VFLKEHLWKTVKKHLTFKRFIESSLMRNADISAATVAKKPRRKPILEVHRFETEAREEVYELCTPRINIQDGAELW